MCDQKEVQYYKTQGKNQSNKFSSLPFLHHAELHSGEK